MIEKQSGVAGLPELNEKSHSIFDDGEFIFWWFAEQNLWQLRFTFSGSEQDYGGLGIFCDQKVFDQGASIFGDAFPRGNPVMIAKAID